MLPFTAATAAAAAIAGAPTGVPCVSGRATVAARKCGIPFMIFRASWRFISRRDVLTSLNTVGFRTPLQCLVPTSECDGVERRCDGMRGGSGRKATSIIICWGNAPTRRCHRCGMCDGELKGNCAVAGLHFAIFCSDIFNSIPSGVLLSGDSRRLCIGAR